MKSTIRQGVFETNSSSSHSLCVCTEEEYEKFESGELIVDIHEAKLIPYPEDYEEYKAFDDEDEIEEPRYIKYNYGPDACINFTSPSGDKMIAFCYEYYY